MAQKRRAPESKRRAVRRRQALAATVLLDGMLLLLFVTLWPELPFPQGAGLLSAFAAGLLFGIVVGRWWTPLLSLCVLPAALAATGSVWAAVVAAFVAGPAVGLGLMAGALWSATRVGPREQHAPARRRRPRARLVEAPQGR